MLSHTFDRYQISMRYDNFETKDKDELVGDDNNGHGEAVTLSFTKQIKQNLNVRFEVTELNSFQANRADLNQEQYTRDALYQVSTQYTW